MKAHSEIAHNQCKFRADLWREFVAHYQLVLAVSPEAFSNYCAEFRKRWVTGK